MIYNKEAIEAIKDKLLELNKTVAAAESVTGGHLQAALSAGTSASQYFQGGITAYNVGQKARHLGIDPIYGAKTDCVAEKVAEEMAKSVTDVFLADYGIAVTGYASMTPEIEKEGLFAYYAIATRKHEVLVHGRMTAKEKDPFDVQVEYTNQLLLELDKLLKRQ